MEEKMAETAHEIKETRGHHHSHHSSKKKYIFPLLFAGVFVFFGIGLFVFAKGYENKTLPGISIGDISIGKMGENELKNFLDTITQKLIADGVNFDLHYPSGTEKFTIAVEAVSLSDVLPYISIDTGKEAKRLVAYGKQGTFLQDAFAIIRSSVSPEAVTLQSVTLRRDRLTESIEEKIKSHEAPPQDARLVFHSVDPLDYTLTSSTAGYIYPIDEALDQVEKNWKSLQSPSVTLASIATLPQVTDSDIAPLLSDLPKYFKPGALILKKQDDGFTENQWKISPIVFSTLLTVTSTGEKSYFTLDTVSTTKYLEKYIAPDVFVEASNAKFEVGEGGKVQEFRAAQKGLSLDTEKTLDVLKSSFENRLNSTSSDPITIFLAEVEPEITTDEVNDIGIKEVLGVGISNYSGSPTNRIKNIKNAIRKLNGIVIKPGEEFSAIRYTEPYTLEGGYFPEKVIKGDEIKPEIGGGLCQVGTTLFRMAMNSGMKITQRRNHSLVVNYYNDPRNGQPGTDATIYDPAPDFKFLNDTNHHILIQTSVNEKTGELKFALWGTNDGRKGSYTRPVVSKWIPTGPTRIVETASLAPGKKECQHAFPGAQTSFTYTRTLSDGTKEDIVYDSYYRPLPEICLVGVAKTPTCPEGESCDVSDIPSDAKPIVDDAPTFTSST